MKQAYAVANHCNNFVKAVQHGKQQAEKDGAVFDSATSDVWDSAPTVAKGLADALPQYTNVYGHQVTGQQAVTSAVLDGVAEFEKRNGFAPSGGLVASALQDAFAAVNADFRSSLGVSQKAAWDDVSNVSGSPMVANVAQLAIYTSIVESVPFGGYVPMSDGMKGKLIIAGHAAASKTGEYDVGGSLDGINSGKTFLSAVREVKAVDGGAHTEYTAKVLYADGDTQGSAIIPSTLQVLLNGIPAARVAVNVSRGVATAPIAGSITIDVNDVPKTYNITGQVTTATGDVNITFNPALEAAHEVFVTASLDFEHASLRGKRPEVKAEAVEYDLTAYVNSGIYRLSQEAKTQWNKDVRLDPSAESMYALRQQAAAERHFSALRSMYRIGKNFIQTFDFKGDARLDARSRASLFDDAFIAITLADQAMLERTNAFGISVIYVGAKGKAYFESLPSPMFVKAGTTSHNGIHRIGMLQGKYQVFYAPNIVKETTNSFEILAVGRSNQIGLNPYIVGDVTGAVMLPLGVNADLEEGMGYFQVGVGTVNPHQKAALGASVIQLTNVV